MVKSSLWEGFAESLLSLCSVLFVWGEVAHSGRLVTSSEFVDAESEVT